MPIIYTHAHTHIYTSTNSVFDFCSFMKLRDNLKDPIQTLVYIKYNTSRQKFDERFHPVIFLNDVREPYAIDYF